MTEFAVMPEGTKLLPGDRVTLVVTVPEDGSMRVRSRDEDIRVIERPVPVVELPTEPGYYEAACLPLSWGYAAYRLHSSGQWYSHSGKVTEARMRELTPLARLVPETMTAPAKLADRIDLEALAKFLRWQAANVQDFHLRAESIVGAIDNGDFDL